MTSRFPRLARGGLFLLLALLAGCAAPTQAPPQPSPMLAALPTGTPLPTQTPPPPTATATLTPLPPTPTGTATTTLPPTETLIPTPTATLTPTLTSAPLSGRTGSGVAAPAGDEIKIYFIEKDTGGGVGCGDSLISAGSGFARVGDIVKDVEAGLRALFSARWEYSGALYNPVSRSTLGVREVSYENGLVQVWLSGEYNPSGDSCDNTRVKAQIWSTIRQFRDVDRTNIYLNNVPFGDRLSNDK